MRMATPRELPSGNWFAQLRINGQSISITRPSQKEAELAVMAAYVKYSSNPSVRQKAITLHDAIDLYIETRSNVISPSTVEGYRVIQRNRFKSCQDKKLQDINNWQMIINLESRIVSAKTVENAWCLVSSVLKENGLPVPSVTLPQKVPNEQLFLDPDEIRIFLSAIEGDPYELPMLLGLHGLRRSEVMALKKENIKDGFILVRGAVVHAGKDKGFVKKKTNKNTPSRRDVPILMDRVQILVDQCETDLLCPWNPSIVYRRLKSICKENNLPEIGFHGLRHSFASLCYHLKLSELETMKLGGWSDPAVMRKIYTHLSRKDLTEGEKRLQAFFR